MLKTTQKNILLYILLVMQKGFGTQSNKSFLPYPVCVAKIWTGSYQQNNRHHLQFYCLITSNVQCVLYTYNYFAHYITLNYKNLLILLKTLLWWSRLRDRFPPKRKYILWFKIVNWLVITWQNRFFLNFTLIFFAEKIGLD